MYRRFRTLHVIAGLLAAPTLLAYAVTAFQLTVPPLGPSTVESQRELRLPATDDVLGQVAALRAQGIGGALTHAAMDGTGAITLELVEGGLRHEAVVQADGRTLVTTARGGTLARIRNLHFVSGRHRDAVGMRWWAHLSWISGVALLVLVASGVTLWLRRPAERRLGIALLVGNLLWCAAALLSLL